MFQSTMDNAACLFLLLLIPSVLSGEGDPESLQLTTSGLSAELKEVKAALAELRTKIEHLEADKQALAAELESLKSRSIITEGQVEALSRDKTDSKVAFSASLVSTGVQTFGPHDVATTLVYKHVASNVGNAYNSLTGLFTAPVKGAYHFEVHIHLFFGDHPAEVYLMKNGQGTYMTYEQQQSGRGTASNSITLLLEVGDLVYVSLPANRQIYDNKYHHSTFSGHLLFPM